ncbi:hypothetical protein S7335_2348 [Synechococcus sp. PCC 7335]|uniref:Na-translocating system protein MpsC family protein n=1 Tax=Synechococcus sp. (strain ATCC 29403 / PCC 7335) TaxID=91464 RepID=UPI00017EB4BA|nr:Na-translocating system protein MpsC family protein [Synechococcus sp. PCC 7335]EDX84651.1 hypothetical protein S7335_2348 [Synechococcus sp. PCC 7335]
MQDPVPANNNTGQSLERQVLEKALGLPSASFASAEHSSSIEAQTRPIIDELLRTTSAAIMQLYEERLGKPPRLVSCNLISDRLVVWIEDSITPVEKFLFSEGNQEAQRLCSTVDRLMYQRLAALVERHLKVSVITMTADTCYENGCTGLIAKLSMLSST